MGCLVPFGMFNDLLVVLLILDKRQDALLLHYRGAVWYGTLLRDTILDTPSKNTMHAGVQKQDGHKGDMPCTLRNRVKDLLFLVRNPSLLKVVTLFDHQEDC